MSCHPFANQPDSNIFLKLENLQPSGSFKSRGIGYMMQQAYMSTITSSTSTHQQIHYFCSSGGNAGLACAVAALSLGPTGPLPATICVPHSTPAHMVARLRAVGPHVTVHQHGRDWGEADRHLREVLMVAAESEAALKGDGAGVKAVYVPPFDHPDIWTGASSIVAELERQFAPDGTGLGDGRGVHAVVCSVGGGGLMCGVMQGLDELPGGRIGRRGDSTAKPTAVIAVETIGADSLHASVVAGELVTLPAITSVATSLGAPRVAERTFAYTRTHASTLTSVVVSDAEAVAGCVGLGNDARLLVEAACGATIATVYKDGGRYLRRTLLGRDDAQDDEIWRCTNVVLVVCGGSNVSFDIIDAYRNRFQRAAVDADADARQPSSK